MRFYFIAFLLGLGLGAIAPAQRALGVNCSTLTNRHDNGDTCCACGYEDFTVDDLETTSAGLSCIYEALDSGAAAFDFPDQCQYLAANTPTDFTVLADREDHDIPSLWYTVTGATSICTPDGDEDDEGAGDNSHLHSSDLDFFPCGG